MVGNLCRRQNLVLLSFKVAIMKSWTFGGPAWQQHWWWLRVPVCMN